MSLFATLVYYFLHSCMCIIGTKYMYMTLYMYIRDIVIFFIQFNNMCPVNNRISEYDFAKSVLTFSSMNDQAKKKFLKRIRRKYGKGLSDCPDSTVGSYLSLSLFSSSLPLSSLPSSPSLSSLLLIIHSTLRMVSPSMIFEHSPSYWSLSVT